MSEERKIEKLLRDYAKQRRAESDEPFQMHSATRNLLQNEVAKHAGKTLSENKLSSWLFFLRWPGFALTFSVVIVVAVGIAVIVPGSKNGKQFQLAKAVAETPPAASRRQLSVNGDSKTPSDLLKPTIAPSAGSPSSAFGIGGQFDKAKPTLDEGKTFADRFVRSEGSLKRNKEESPAQKIESFAVVAPAKTVEKLPATTDGNRNFFGENSPRGQSAFTTNVGKEPGVSGGYLAANSSKSETFARVDGEVDREKFRLAKSTGGKDAQTNLSLGSFRSGLNRDSGLGRLLASFQFVQAGNEIQVIDDDGSVYKGHLISTEENQKGDRQYYKFETATKKLEAPKESVATTTGGAIAEKAAQSFQVTGTNRTLNAQVVFNGTFFFDSSAASVETRLDDVVRNPGSVATNAVPAQSFGSRISGTMRVGGQEIPIDARKVTP